ncbi:MAG: site-2 protease family protein [Deltaproteobacteria bacterium]|nr:site-2 protease family protein [Deltaproteobacteria bacterium]
MRLLLLFITAGLALALRELGRALAAGLLGLRVQGFTVGFGPPMWTLEAWGRTWTLAAFPFGARAHVAGLNPVDPDAGPGDLRNAPAWRRWVFLAAGPAFSLLGAWALLVLLYATGTHAPVSMTIGTVQPGTEAARAGLRTGDMVASVEGQPLEQWGALVEKVRRSPGKPLELIVHRDAALLKVVVEPRPDEAGAGRLGITQLYEHRAFPLRDAAGRASGHLWRMAGDGVRWLTPGGLPGLPSRLVRQAGGAFSTGADAFLRLLAGFCAALGLLHLVPIPPLDAGTAWLQLLRPRLRPRWEVALTAAGALGLLALAASAAMR